MSIPWFPNVMHAEKPEKPKQLSDDPCKAVAWIDDRPYTCTKKEHTGTHCVSLGDDIYLWSGDRGEYLT